MVGHNVTTSPQAGVGGSLSRRRFLSLTTSAGLGASLFGFKTVRAAPLLADAINKAIDDYMADESPIGLAVATITTSKDSTPRIQTYFRGETVDGNRTKPDESTIFELGSITKVFTAALLAQMVVNQKQLQLDDLVQSVYDKLLPGSLKLPTYKGQAIRFIHLATHTAGFPDDPDNVKGSGPCDYQPQEMYQALNNLKLTQAPGGDSSYSNLGFGLLADALCVINKKRPYESVIRDLFNAAQLKMPDTHIMTADFKDRRFAQGYGRASTQKKAVPADQCMPTWPAFNGAGALRSTLTDMIEWISFHLGITDSPLENIVPFMLKPRHDFGKQEQIGLGWQLRALDVNPKLTAAAKNGGTKGFGTDTIFVRETKTAVISLTNLAGSNPTKLNWQLIEILNGA